MHYFGASINQSAVVAEKAGAELKMGAFLAVKYDSDGNVIVCDTAGEQMVGVLLPETPDTVTAGTDTAVQIKDIGLVKTGGAVAKGAELTVDNKGRFVTAVAGDFVAGYAMSSAAAQDSMIYADIRKCGFKPV